MTAPGDNDISSVPLATPKRGLMSRLSTGHVIMILAGLLAALLNFSLLQQRDETFSVVVASGPLLPGQTVQLADFDFVEIRATDEVLGTLIMADEISAIEGQVSVRSVPAGNLVLVSDFRTAAAPLEQRAMSIPIDEERAVAGELTSNDLIDIIVVDDGVASYIAIGIEILALPADQEGIGSADFSVTVAIDAETALKVASALDYGELHLVRSTGAALPEIETFDPNVDPDEEPVDEDAIPSEGEDSGN